jgi:hypothetical protein
VRRRDAAEGFGRVSQSAHARGIGWWTEQRNLIGEDRMRPQAVAAGDERLDTLVPVMRDDEVGLSLARDRERVVARVHDLGALAGLHRKIGEQRPHDVVGHVDHRQPDRLRLRLRPNGEAGGGDTADKKGRAHVDRHQ